MRSSDSAHYVTMMTELAGNTERIELQIWDLPGKDSFLSLNRMYFRDANVALIIYDVNDPESLRTVDTWLTEL